MENIDDLMRQKFDSDDPAERFEFQEEYWEQAQALLEQEEERRRRWLWLFFALALAIALGTWLLLGHPGVLSQKFDATGNSTTSTDNTEKQIHREETAPSEEGSAKISSPNQTGSNEKAFQNTESSKNALTANQNRNKEGRASGPDATKGASGKNKRSTAHSRASGLSEWSDMESRKNQGVVKPGTSSDQEKAPINGVAASGKPEAGGSGQSSIHPANPAPADKSGQENPITEKQQGGKTGDNNEAPAPQTPSVETPAPQYPNVPTINLETPLYPLILPIRVYAPPLLSAGAKEPIAVHTQPVENHRFSLGLSLAGAAYQNSDTASSAWAGWAIGPFGTYRLNKNWSVGLGAQWRFIPGHGLFSGPDSDNPDFVENLRYSFGYKSEQWKIETRGLHCLEIPVSAMWHKGRLGLEAGGTAGVLFAVQNRVEHTVSSSLEPATTTVDKFVKGNLSLYNRQYLSGLIGVEYRLNRWISAMARAQYRFTPIYQTVPTGVRNPGLSNLELGLRLRMF